MLMLHRLKEVFGQYSLTSYYACQSTLALEYVLLGLNFGINLYCKDAEHALNKVSNGKCRIQTYSETDTVVVCEVAGADGEN